MLVLRGFSIRIMSSDLSLGSLTLMRSCIGDCDPVAVMILMSSFCFCGMLAIRVASSIISCCSLYENTITDLSLSFSSSVDSEVDLVDLMVLFGTGEICVKESLDESADDVGGVLDVLVALNGCSFVRGRRKKVFLQFSSNRLLA